jgi:hypothetical protein
MPQFLVERDSDGEISLAMDAQPGLTTVSNAGVPAFLTNYMDPKPIKILFAPMAATEVFDEEVRGAWTTQWMTFKYIEHTGETAAYGDYSENGLSGANVNFPQRQSFLYQTVTQYGDLEVEEGALAQVDFVSEKNIGSILALNKFQNYSYLYGIDGLMNYGMLNYPTLSAPLAPGAKAYNSNVSGPWLTSGIVTATPSEVMKDVQRLYSELVEQSQGLVNQDSPLKLVMSPSSLTALTATNETFATNVYDLLKKNWKNLTYVTVPEYDTDAGEVVQLICTSIMGQATGITATNCKLRSGRIIPSLSSFRQKKVQGTWGAVIYQPFAVAQMIGV